MGDVADRIHGHPHAIPGPPECSVAFGAPCPAGLALVIDANHVNCTGIMFWLLIPDA